VSSSIQLRILVSLLGGLVASCGTPSTTGCALAADTAATATVAPSGCAVLSRDTSSCVAARQAAGLSGYWLKFSCRVTLSKTTQSGVDLIQAQSDGQPDYKSNYFQTTDACHEDYTGAIQNPNLIAAKSYTVSFPLSPNTSSQAMHGAVVGMVLNGVPVFGNFAAPGDDIYQEARTFDRCGAHPQQAGAYHYHGEPYAVTYDDSNFVGVMRDGYPIYGRRDPDGSAPALDEFGGHTGVTVDSPSTAVYHYHVNEQTSTDSRTSGQKQFFLTKGTFRGTPAACSTCN
jgi:YHYH protein